MPLEPVPVNAVRCHTSANPLANIERDNLRGLNLRAVLHVAPEHDRLRSAQTLDDERSAGTVRSEMHGIPILVKWVGAGPAQPSVAASAYSVFRRPPGQWKDILALLTNTVWGVVSA